MKGLIVTVLLLGCAHAAPPWPKPSPSDTDGGESLAPHESKIVASADKETKADAKSEPKSDAPAKSPGDAKPATAQPAENAPAAAASVPEEEGEETIIIDIDD